MKRRRFIMGLVIARSVRWTTKKGNRTTKLSLYKAEGNWYNDFVQNGE